MKTSFGRRFKEELCYHQNMRRKRDEIFSWIFKFFDHLVELCTICEGIVAIYEVHWLAT